MPILAAGCTATPLRTPQVAVPPAFDVPRAWDAADASSVASLEWWKAFDDDQLTGLIERSLVAAPDARTALAALDEARAVRSQALTQFDPQGVLDLSANRQTTHVNALPVGATAVDGSNVTLGAAFAPSWEIDLFGRRRAARTSADADYAAARFSYQASRLALGADIATSLFEARSLAAQYDETQETVRIASELARIGRIRAERGLGAQADAARLEADVASAQGDLLALGARLAVSKRLLLVLIGQGTASLSTLVIEPVLGSPPRPPRVTPGEVMNRRPDIRQAAARLQSAAGSLRLDELALFPKLTLEPGASFTRITGPAGYATSLWSIGAGLAMPILDRPRLLAQIRIQSARGEQAVIAYEKAVQTAYGEAENTLTTLTADMAQLDRLDVAERQSRNAFDAQRRGYQAGITDLESLLSTERSWRAARLALIQLRGRALGDAVAVFKALGGSWSSASHASIEGMVQ